MKLEEEQVAFYYALGRAIDVWADLEGFLAQLAAQCVSMPDRNALIASYHAIENFRSKVAFCDALMSHAYGDRPAFPEWKVILDRLLRLSRLRNRLAHGHMFASTDWEIGRRIGIVDPRSGWQPIMSRLGKEPVLPPTAICLRDVAKSANDFRAGLWTLMNFRHRLHGGEGTRPRAFEQEQGRPTIREIRNRIRGELELPLLPSRK